MKLSIDTWVFCADWSLDKLIEVCRSAGYAGAEFRAEDGQKHGVELEATAAQRQEIRRKLEDGYIEASCISTSQCLHQFDEKKRKSAIDRAKRFVDLAADIDCRAIRVFGDGDRIGDTDSRQAICSTGDALHDAIRAARVVVVPSEWYENLPYAVLEAFALGRAASGLPLPGRALVRRGRLHR